MATTTTTSNQFRLNLKDLLNGLILAVAAPVAKVILDSINAGSVTFNWVSLWKVAVSAAVAYLVKKYLTPGQVVVTNVPKETVDAVKAGESTAVIVAK